ncbi:Eukaryotic translation initiation factor 3 subunit E [Penicillium maclennaniae]|uniref:Eukaryotic translation initiation factor 3 subunit E n=1 Tax=Penicillium maclennaniae TaxID=1343394 RepID=UPI00254038B6|nr:Eukaryotic translation initiation factor 3 subunit E [Penicillium maclennaniae]KAJ5683825.1 Eukaryotic translation initiation factor 3 subunit E [Penicillium maclennaniae]
MATTAPAEGTRPTDYDLMPRIIPYLDRHLVFPLLMFRSEEDNEYIRLAYELLKPTNIVGFSEQLWGMFNDTEAPAELKKKEADIAAEKERLEAKTEKMNAVFADEEVLNSMRSDKAANFRFLEENYGVTNEMVNDLYDYGRFLYSTGDYGNAAITLFQFRFLSTDNEKLASATWGHLACEILNGRNRENPAWEQSFEAALGEVPKVKDSIETRLFSNPLGQLHSRTWLIHWCLFLLFDHDSARDTITDLFFSPAFINTIQTSCPRVLRYLAAAVVTNRNRPHKHSGVYPKQLKDLVRVVRQEGYEYSDPITDFVKALHIDFDFEEAQKKLGEAEAVLRDDFFLHGQADAFIEAARHLISESYCKIHQRIDIKDLSTRLGLSEDEGEKWIVNLIRNTRVDAKIDYKAGTVIMNHPPSSVYQQVIEKTKGAFFRTQVLSSAVAK